MIRVTSNGISWMADASGKILTIRTNLAPDIVANLDPEKKYVIEIHEKKRKRSLDQNAMYWSILGQVAKAIGISNARCHNMMLRDYGQPLIVEGEYICAMIRDTDEAEEQCLESETTHMKPTSHTQTGKDGKQYRVYQVMRGSSTYDSAEFTRLLNGLQEEARQMGLTLIWEDT